MIKNLIKPLFTTYFVVLIGVILCVLSIAIMTAWRLGDLSFIRVLPQFVAFQFNSAACFFLTGIGFIAFHRLRRLSLVVGLCLIVVAGGTLVEYIFTLNLHNDVLNIFPPGRIFPFSALCFLLIGFAFIFVTRFIPLRVREFVIFMLGLFIFAFSTIALFDYVLAIPANFGWGALTRMALLEAFAFLLASSAIIGFIWQDAAKEKVDLKVYLPIATIIIGITFFALVRVVLVSQEYREVAVTVRLVAENYKSQLGLETKRYLNSFRRMQFRWQQNGGPSRVLWQNEAGQYIHDFGAYKALSWVDKQGVSQWLVAQPGQKVSLKASVEHAVTHASSLQHVLKLPQLIFSEQTASVYLIAPTYHRAKLRGYLVGMVDVARLLHSIGNAEQRQHYRMSVSYQGRVLYRHPHVFASQMQAYQTGFNLPGTDATLVIKTWPTPSLIKGVLSWYPMVSFGVGSLITLLLAFLLKLWQAAERREAARRVSQRLLLKAHNKLKATTQMMIQTEKMSVLGTFAAGTAHELNNPLMGILNYVQYCKKRTDESDPRFRVLQDAEHEVLRCSQIIKNLLSFSRMNKEGEEKVVVEDIAVVIERVLKLLTYRIRNEGVLVISDYGRHDNAVPMRSNKMQQVFVNLISNALDALQDKETKEIRIKVQSTEDDVSISISDNGSGIPKTIRRQIFDAFITTKPAGEGTGLGLAVTQHIIEEHQGRILCDSAEGEGTKFTIILPMKNE